MARTPKTSPKAGNTVRVDRKQGSSTAVNSTSIAADLAGDTEAPSDTSRRACATTCDDTLPSRRRSVELPRAPIT